MTVVKSVSFRGKRSDEESLQYKQIPPIVGMTPQMACYWQGSVATACPDEQCDIGKESHNTSRFLLPGKPEQALRRRNDTCYIICQ
jgi:hypothetical protein